MKLRLQPLLNMLVVILFVYVIMLQFTLRDMNEEIDNLNFVVTYLDAEIFVLGSKVGVDNVNVTLEAFERLNKFRSSVMIPSSKENHNEM